MFSECEISNIYVKINEITNYIDLKNVIYQASRKKRIITVTFS